MPIHKNTIISFRYDEASIIARGVVEFLPKGYKHKHTEGNITAWNIRNYSQSEIFLQTIEMICCIKIDFICKTFGLDRKSTTQVELTIFSDVER